MTPQQIEQEILNVLAESTTAVGISDKLFTPDGLFSRLASTEEERRVMVQTPLFKHAQRRFRELQFKEAEEFQKTVNNLQGTGLTNNYRVSIERIKAE
jgi:hypothetical protein